jgi:hypothetical protein
MLSLAQRGLIGGFLGGLGMTAINIPPSLNLLVSGSFKDAHVIANPNSQQSTRIGDAGP